MRVVEEIEIERAFAKARNATKEDQGYKNPQQCFYTTADIGDYILKVLEGVRREILSRSKESRR